MFFWVSLGIFLGFASVSALSYRRQIKGLLPTNQKIRSDFDFFEGDKLLIEEKHYSFSTVLRATDGIKNLRLGLVDSNEKIFISLWEQKEIILQCFCDRWGNQPENREFLESFQMDGVIYDFRFETRMKIENPGNVLLGDNKTLLLKMYEAKNKHQFITCFQSDEQKLVLQGEAYSDQGMMLLPGA